MVKKAKLSKGQINILELLNSDDYTLYNGRYNGCFLQFGGLASGRVIKVNRGTFKSLLDRKLIKLVAPRRYGFELKSYSISETGRQILKSS